MNNHVYSFYRDSNNGGNLAIRPVKNALSSEECTPGHIEPENMASI